MQKIIFFIEKNSKIPQVPSSAPGENVQLHCGSVVGEQRAGIRKKSTSADMSHPHHRAAAAERGNFYCRPHRNRFLVVYTYLLSSARRQNLHGCALDNSKPRGGGGVQEFMTIFYFFGRTGHMAFQQARSLTQLLENVCSVHAG